MKKVVLILLLLVASIFAQAAIPQGTTSPIPSMNTASCADSDNGLNPDIAGYVTAGNATYNDTCVSQGVVREYYCANNAVGSSDLNCPIGKSCVQGACIITLGTTGQQATVTPQNQNGVTNQSPSLVVPNDPTVYANNNVQTPTGGFDLTLVLCGGLLILALVGVGYFAMRR